MKLLLQFPEGLKKEAVKYAEKYRKEGHTVYLSSAACFGACDLALEEAKLINADKIIHFGHAPFIREKLPIDVEYVEYRTDINLNHFSKTIYTIPEYLKNKKVGIATTVQHIHQLNDIKSMLQSEGYEVFIGKGINAFYPGQVLGCDGIAITSIINNIDFVLFIGDGLFHPLAIKIDKPVFVYSPGNPKITEISGLIAELKKKRKGLLTLALTSKTFGILLSTKIGQRNVKLAEEIKKKLELKGKQAEILIANTFDPYSLENFQSFDCYITTACPRMSDDSQQYNKPILDVSLFVEFMKLLDD